MFIRLGSEKVPLKSDNIKDVQLILKACKNQIENEDFLKNVYFRICDKEHKKIEFKRVIVRIAFVFIIVLVIISAKII